MRGLPLVALGTAAVLLAGCSADAGSTPAPLASSPVATAEPSPTPTLSDRAAVEAAARNYYAVLTRIGMTPDIEPYKAVTTDLCACRRGIFSFVRNLQRKRWRVTAKFVATSVVVNRVEAGQATATVVVSVAPFVALDSAGRVVDRDAPKSPDRNVLIFEKHAARWLVANVSRS